MLQLFAWVNIVLETSILEDPHSEDNKAEIFYFVTCSRKFDEI
jgi:hypothetical protein